MGQRKRTEYTVITPTGEAGGIWSFESNANDYLKNGHVRQATDQWDNLLFTESGDPVWEQAEPVPAPGSYVAKRTWEVPAWEPATAPEPVSTRPIG